MNGQTSQTCLMDSSFLEQAAETLKVVAHPVRLRLLELICREEVPVTLLAEQAGIPQAVASQHLRLLARAGAVESRRAGHQVYYYITNPHVLALLSCMQQHAPGMDTSQETRP